MPAILPDKTLSILLKDVVFKGFIVVYDSQSPTRNKKAAIQKMLEAGEFIAHHGVDMSQELFDDLGNRYTEYGRLVLFYSPTTANYLDSAG